jgi:hypothetical protein
MNDQRPKPGFIGQMWNKYVFIELFYVNTTTLLTYRDQQLGSRNFTLNNMSVLQGVRANLALQVSDGRKL